MTTSVTRRRVLGLGIGAGAAITLATAGPVQAAAPAADEHQWRRPRSANGWPVLDDATRYRVEGTDVEVSLAKGDAATVLLYVARRFAYEIDMLRPGDVQGHTLQHTVRADFESNYLSGTAIAIRPLFYPLGAQQGTGLSDLERVVIADILADCQDVVGWGGHEKQVKESHFQIDVRPGDPGLARLARRIRGEGAVPGSGAGSIDPFLPDRRRKAAAYI
ncbi:hypothetical protein [Streptomyces nodosus]|uniref:hypothetical protein n=1 Tax=Streptomyces nodosus TaxID=40318 RepID=UPI00382A23BF